MDVWLMMVSSDIVKETGTCLAFLDFYHLSKVANLASNVSILIIKKGKNLFKSTNFNLQIHNTFYNSNKHHQIHLRIITGRYTSCHTNLYIVGRHHQYCSEIPSSSVVSVQYRWYPILLVCPQQMVERRNKILGISYKGLQMSLTLCTILTCVYQ